MEKKVLKWIPVFVTTALFGLSVFTGCTPSSQNTAVQKQQQIQTDTVVRNESQSADPAEKPSTRRMEQWTGISYQNVEKADNVDELPAYDGIIYAVINDNQPLFSEEELSNTESYESYSDLDALGRCQTAEACIGQDIMPDEERGPIGQVKPTGWHTIKYDCIDGLYLYNRCHLIAFELAAENANEKNLITGTRYMNVEGMLPFENMVTDFIKDTGYHVLYRVTPIFEGDNLIASGVQMEARSIEDSGEGICFNVYVYNVQPHIAIDYANGDSWESEENVYDMETSQQSDTSGTDKTTESTGTFSDTEKGVEDETEILQQTYILNTNTKKFHKPSCNSVTDMSESNKQEYTGDKTTLLSEGYLPCKRCNP